MSNIKTENSIKKNNCGSEWNKWDLHVHTPETKLCNQYSIDSKNLDEIWDLFLDKIEQSDVSVFGITDYFSTENYFKFTNKFKTKYPKSRKVFFPNIEFRIDSKNSKNHHIHIHILFSDQVKCEKLDDFLTRLKLISTDDEKLTNKYCTDQDLKEVKYDKAMVTMDNLVQKLKENFSENEYLIVGVANGYGSLRPEVRDGKGAEYAKELDKKCHLFFGKSDNTGFYLNKQNGRTKYKLPPKAIITGCDAHSFDGLDKKLGKNYKNNNDDYSETTWIKANTTFEGLKQIIYEPEERVSIKKENPSYNFDKPFFSEININDQMPVLESEDVEFKLNTIPLNKNLVTFIGGRGSGKSLFLNYIGSRFDKLKNQTQFTDGQDFNIMYKKENLDNTPTEFKGKDNNLDFVFIEQSKIKKITEGYGLKNEIKKLLGLEDLKFNERLISKTAEILDEINKLNKIFSSKDEDGNQINSKDYQDKVKKENTNLLTTITTETNREQLEQYTKNISKIQEVKGQIEIIDQFKEKLDQNIQDLNKTIKKINNIFVEKEELKLKEINFESRSTTMEKQKKFLTNEIEIFEKENIDIKNKFKSKGFKGDLTALLKNASTYQEKIEKSEQKLKQIKDKESELENYKKQRANLGVDIKHEYERQMKKIKEKWDSLLEIGDEEQQQIIKDIILKEDIKLDVDIKFDEDRFYDLIFDKVDKRTYRKIDTLKETFEIPDFDSWVSFFNNDNFDAILKNESFKNFISQIFFDLNIRNEYIQVLPELKYKDKPIEKLSAGQKGTLYLRLQLATNAFSSPIIFDQPEDDLDNKFIIDELVPMLKKLKKYRQIIIATHNANLVVSADAEQIIIADNQDEKLSYCAGAIEDPKIKDSICDILEGGKDAFEKRRKKYNL